MKLRMFVLSFSFHIHFMLGFFHANNAFISFVFDTLIKFHEHNAKKKSHYKDTIFHAHIMQKRLLDISMCIVLSEFCMILHDFHAKWKFHENHTNHISLSIEYLVSGSIAVGSFLI